MYMCACDVCVGELHVYVCLFGCLYFCVLRHPRDCDLDVLMYINLKEETRCYRNFELTNITQLQCFLSCTQAPLSKVGVV